MMFQSLNCIYMYIIVSVSNIYLIIDNTLYYACYYHFFHCKRKNQTHGYKADVDDVQPQICISYSLWHKSLIHLKLHSLVSANFPDNKDNFSYSFLKFIKIILENVQFRKATWILLLKLIYILMFYWYIVTYNDITCIVWTRR